jgi:hypothetical protein
MPAFNAETVVEGLDFSFEPFVHGCSGTIREPTDQQIADWLTGIKAVVSETQAALPDDVDPSNQAALLDAMDNLSPEIVVTTMQKMATVYAALCSGFPTVEQILALPMRRRNLFFGWVQQEVMSPEAGPGAGNVAAMPPPRAVAG